ncbi:hypothetical protein HY68_01240 [Streptomyces sp. AcH 505]|uniref:helix-turn-helix transcriptional regulator n=1 Tax=Streptomyces sp. AcH 505 TaxID=352211 RepID=UPI0005923E79|nr:hypothetical protein HY68_01240 [Streptomyces sp. AcH 505]
MPDVTTESGRAPEPPSTDQATSDLTTEEWLTPKDVCMRTKIPVGTLGQWRHAGIGPKWTKFEGSIVRYPLSGYREWLARQQQSATA